MKRLLVTAGTILFLQGLCAAQAGTWFTNAVIVITPAKLDFGAVAAHQTATNTFLVENAGGGKLVGKATVAPPFKIIEGGSYRFRQHEVQVVTLIYSPRSARTNLETIRFTGAGGAKATVIGRLKGSLEESKPH